MNQVEIKRLGDLVVDDLGNYYHITEKDGQTLTLANAFMELSFRRRLDDNYIDEHKGEYVGTHAVTLLKSLIERIQQGKTSLKIIPLRELEKQHTIIIETLFERT